MPQAELFQIPESGLAYMGGGTRDFLFREMSVYKSCSHEERLHVVVPLMFSVKLQLVPNHGNYHGE